MPDHTRSAHRKQSPDVLAELLGTDVPPSPMPDLQSKVTTERAVKSRSQAARPRQVPQPIPAAPTPEPQPVAWEAEIVTFQEHRGWRPRFVNGVEVANWLAGPLVHDFLRERGAEGWEVAAATTAGRFYGSADGLQVYFKRRK